MKKYLAFLLPLLIMPFVSADCGITNLASCISQSFFDFLLSILNAPVQPLLDAVHSLLTEPVNIDLFSGVWGIIVYILSLFYGILLMYVGFKFIISGHSVEMREKAKSDLANILIMIVLVQASFYLYSLLNQVIASVTAVTLNMIQENFFLLTLDNVTNIGLEFVMLIPYLISIVTTLVLLTLRYVIVSAGVLLFVFGIFFYFFPPLKQYGKLIINFLISTMAMTLFYSIIFLACSMLLEITVFQNFKMLVMIGAFTLVNIITIVVAFFVIVKAASSVAEPIMKVVSVVGAVAGA
jgi:hypothetical protein